jgi:hypothetical protein
MAAILGAAPFGLGEYVGLCWFELISAAAAALGSAPVISLARLAGTHSGQGMRLSLDGCFLSYSLPFEL